MPSRFLQLHTLTSYPASLLNRDDAGFAKRIPFGGVTRTRVSSQCLKRHWRTFDGEHALSALGVQPSVRSRLTFQRFVLEPLMRDDGVDEKLARAVTEALMAEVLGQSAKAKREKEKTGDDGQPRAGKSAESGRTGSEIETGQITVLGRPEVEYLRKLAGEICQTKPDLKKAADAVKERLGKDGRENLRALKKAAGLDAALFGRMVTSDYLARGDAAVHVAHAFTVHAEAAESDYFSAVDDLLQDGDEEKLGSGHIGSAELTSGLFYGYVVVDIPLLVSNLEGCKPVEWTRADRTLAARVVQHLVHLVATVSPGAKRGSTAPYAFAHLMLAEAGNAQPRTLANAFLKPVSERPDLVANTYAALATYVADVDRMYGVRTRRALAAIGPADELCRAVGVERPAPLTDVADWAAAQVKEA